MGRKVYDGRIVHLEVEHVRLPNQVEIDLEIVRHPGASAVVAEEGGEVILIRQYRHAGGGYLWEIPAGTLHVGERPDACASRELAEEAGVEARELIHLGSILTTPGFCDERIHLFLARQLRPVETNHDRDEVITEVRRVPWDEVLRMMGSADIVDAKSLVGLYHAARWLGIPHLLGAGAVRGRDD
jgi:ADP-ribose pyrophosphatase